MSFNIYCMIIVNRCFTASKMSYTFYCKKYICPTSFYCKKDVTQFFLLSHSFKMSHSFFYYKKDITQFFFTARKMSCSFLLKERRHTVFCTVRETFVLFCTVFFTIRELLCSFLTVRLISVLPAVQKFARDY